jgi:hypothetical protein
MRKYYNITGEAFEHGPNMLLFSFALFAHLRPFCFDIVAAMDFCNSQGKYDCITASSSFARKLIEATALTLRCQASRTKLRS